MKNENADIVAVPIGEIRAGEPCPEKLFLLLPKNCRLIPLVNEGDALTSERILRLAEYRYKQLWRFRVSKAASLSTADQAADFSPAEADLLVRRPDVLLSHVKAVLAKAESEPERSAEALKVVSQSVLKMLSQVRETDVSAAKEVMSSCRSVVDEVLRIASEESDIYTQILALRQANSDVEHSTAVGTMAVMFALSLGLHDQTLLNDLATASLFHDIGVSDIDPALASKPRESMSAAELKAYYRHVRKSTDTLRAAELPLRQRVYDLIAKHHQCYDGSGYPDVMGDTDEAAQILALADRFDELCNGGALSPAEALDLVYRQSYAKGGKVVARLEIVERIFQFMKVEHHAAAALREKAESEAQDARGSL